MIKKYFLLWFVLLLIAIFNGALRDLAYRELLGDLPAHQVSTLTGILFMGLFIRWIMTKWKLPNARTALIIGLMWLIMTEIFEFGFGHFLSGKSWEILFNDYNLCEGRVWIVFLIWITFAPYIFFKFSKK